MAVTYGFFNSVNGDRKYNAEQMSEYFRGIVNEGVFQHLDGGLAVTAGTGLAVSVASGRAIIQNRWVQNSDAMTLSISAASETYARKDAVVVRLNYSTRSIEIAVKAGTPAASPSAPSMTRNSTTYEMALAYVNVAANATSVTVTDKRSDSTVCGWVTVAQSTSGEVDAQLNAMKTGFDGVSYASPAAQVIANDTLLHGELDDVADYFSDIINSGSQVKALTYENGYRVSDNIYRVVNQATSCVSNIFYASQGSTIKITGIASGQQCNLISETLSSGYYDTNFEKTGWYDGLYAVVVKNSDSSSILPSNVNVSVEVVDGNSRISDIEDSIDVISETINASKIDITTGAYIKTYISVGSVVDLTPVSNLTYGYAIVNCSENDLFTITGSGGVNPLLWAFIDSANKIISKSAENITLSNFVLKAPANTAKAIFNVQLAVANDLHIGVLSKNIDNGNGVINLCAMGAKSGTDITNIFKQAIANVQGTCTIYLPAGEYEISESLVWKSGISFKGDGIDQTIILHTGGESVFSGRNISGFTMEGFTIDGTAVMNTWSKGIFQKYITDVIYRDIKIQNTGATGLGSDFLTDCIIENIFCDNCGASGNLDVLPDGDTTAAGCSGIGIGTVNNRYNNEAVVVSNCITNNCKQYGIFFENQTAQTAEGIGIKIIGCSATGNRTGFGISGNDSALVIGCTAYANHHAGFAYDSGTMIKESGDHSLSGRRVKFVACVASYSGINMPNNYPEFRGQTNGHGFFIAHNYDGCEMIGCTARKNIKHGLCIANGITDLSIIGGTFSENTEDGIYISGAMDKFKLHPSFVESNEEVGIEFDGQISNGTMKDIIVTGNETGIKASSTTTMTNVINDDNLVYDNTTNLDNIA